MSGFADRFYWARHRAGLGAPTIAGETGCAQALINNIEHGKGAKGSKFNDDFAKLFRVDPEWLRNGSGKAPGGFDSEEAHRMRLVSSLRGHKYRPLGNMSREESFDIELLDAMQIHIMTNLFDFASMVGSEQTGMLVEALRFLAILAANHTQVARASEDLF
jgi:transcriptional regulator with XRE-family HTH domain